ncbi:MAG TPA: ATP-binding protein, partial [Polyangiaceae bacterium LLY-WYZ-14_1]|nr:ATP-binding protein [Polyangiaceae bacterium LLY-WYZ-14_1]
GHPERRLALAARRPGDGDGGAGWVEVEVRDTGPGLPGEAVADLFRPFMTTKEAGTGLGLPIVQRIVEQHGGLVMVGPGPEGGTSACFRLPSWRNDDG